MARTYALCALVVDVYPLHVLHQQKQGHAKPVPIAHVRTTVEMCKKQAASWHTGWVASLLVEACGFPQCEPRVVACARFAAR